MKHDRNFTKEEIHSFLGNAMNKTLGEVDINHVFDATLTHPKITGIAGDVIELSVLGMERDTRPEPDITIDGEQVELKTTGIRKSKDNPKLYEGKEPLTVTAVSVNSIVSESFDNSKFWNKLDKVLLVYYEYLSEITVPAREYMNFPLKGYQIHQFNETDQSILKSDWELVKKYIKNIQDKGFPESEYAGLSHDLRGDLLYIDTSPKWPNKPRFRLKRTVVTSIVQEYFAGGEKHETLPELTSINALKDLCTLNTKKYAGKTMRQLAKLFGLNPKTKSGRPNKALAEQIIVRMMGGHSSKINNIDLFKKAGIMGKTIIFSNEGGRTEDTKLFTIDFEEWLNQKMIFEESQIYEYFTNNQILCILFQETKAGDMLKSKFLGFKRLCFSEDFINTYAKRIWDDVRNKIFNNELVETICKRKDGTIIKNKVGTNKTAVNFPKSGDHMYLFLRGTSKDSTLKPLTINGISMYNQQVWIRGQDIIALLKEEKML